MRVYVDFDGVLADTGIAKRRWLEANVGGRFDASLDRTTLEARVGREAYLAMQAKVGFRDTLDAPPMHEAGAVIVRLAKVASIIVITARPPEKLIWVERWLQLHRLEHVVESVLSSWGRSKSGLVCDMQEGWLIDDDPRHADGLPSHVAFLLFGAEARRHGRIRTVEDWRGVQDAILGACVSARCFDDEMQPDQ